MYFLAIKSVKISIRKCFYCVVLHCLFSFFTTIAQTNPQSEPGKTTILVIGLQPTQFYSNVYYIDELARLNDTSQAQATELYSKTLVGVLTGYNSDRYRFIA